MHFFLACVCILNIKDWPNIIEYWCEIRRVILLRKSLLVVLLTEKQWWFNKNQVPADANRLIWSRPSSLPGIGVSGDLIQVQFKLNSEKCIFIIMIFSCNRMNYHYIQGVAGEYRYYSFSFPTTSQSFYIDLETILDVLWSYSLPVRLQCSKHPWQGSLFL